MIQNIKTQDQARQYAIDWQIKQGEQSISFGELAEQQVELRELAERFDLVEEFKENAII